MTRNVTSIARACLVAAGLLLALAPLALPVDYDPWRHTISESAGQGVPGAGWARAGLAAYGLGALAMAVRLRGTVAEASALAVFGAGLLGSAWWPHRPWWPAATFDAIADQRHSLCAQLAGLGFVLAAVLCALRLRRQRGRWRWQEPAVLALALGASLLQFIHLDGAGAAQRLMFAAGLFWLFFLPSTQCP